MSFDELFFRFHAIERMLEQDISETDVREVLEQEDVIERTVDQFGMCKELSLGFVERRPFMLFR